MIPKEYLRLLGIQLNVTIRLIIALGDTDFEVGFAVFASCLLSCAHPHSLQCSAPGRPTREEADNHKVNWEVAGLPVFRCEGPSLVGDAGLPEHGPESLSGPLCVCTAAVHNVPCDPCEKSHCDLSSLTCGQSASPLRWGSAARIQTEVCNFTSLLWGQ